jgi:2-polyprenyl-3-methyl-5-hydroxy-6-metoxy-1,4-benzoquinol methylase
MFSILANRRVVTAEIMDSPDIAPAEHVQALAGLRRINKVSGVAEQMVRPILDLTRAENLKRISMLDVACGGGDVPIAVAQQLKQEGVDVDLTFLDRSGTALKQAAGAAERAGISCQVVQHDAAGIASLKSVDVVTNSLFLHHLSKEEDVINLLRSMRGLARRIVVISDLRRSVGGFAAAWLGCRLLSRSPVVHFDGPVSVRAAWTVNELEIFAAQAEMHDAVIREVSPWRMLLVWKRLPGALADESN